MINHSIERESLSFNGYYGSTRTPLLELLDKHQPQSVLEIGCGRGATLAELKRRFPGCRTAGIELRPDVGHFARDSGAADTMQIGDVLDLSAVRVENDSVDLLVMSHVLEHFAEPERVLARALPWLRRDGVALIALPNVRHMSVLIDVIFRGDFRYRDSGILDRTHLRFFTRRSAERFLSAQGLKIEAVRGEVNGVKSTVFDRLTLGTARGFSAYAFNFRVRKA